MLISNNRYIIFTFLKLFIFFIFPASFTFAQFYPGARQIALAHSDVAFSNDAFSIYNNPSGLARLPEREFGIYYSPAPFGLKQLSNASAAYSEPTSLAVFSIGFTTYGFDLFRENKFALSVSKKFYDNFYFGITTVYQTIKIQNYGSDGTLNLIVGGQADLTENFKWGFVIENILRATYGNEKDQIPVVYKTGLTYLFLDNLLLNLSVDKEINFPISVKSGIEFIPVKFVSLRFGFCNSPSSFAGGIGINYSFFHIDYAFTQNQALGISHQFGIIINMNKNN